MATPTDGYGVYEACNPTQTPQCYRRLDQIASGGFSLVLNYNLLNGHIADLIAYADYAHGVGLKVIWPLHNHGIWGAYSTTVLDDVPLNYYRLDETSGTIANDIGGNGQNGTLNGGITLSQTGLLTGDSDTSMLFNGSTGYISLPTTGLPTGVQSWSIEAWIRFSSVPGSGTFDTVFCFGTATTNQAVDLFFRGSSGTFELDSWSSQIIQSNTGVVANTNYHLVVTYDGATVKLYQNNALVGSASYTFNIGSTFAQIGNDSVGDYFSGIIDEVAVYNYTLSTAQISAHYNRGTGTTAIATTYPSLYADSGNQATDSGFTTYVVNQVKGHAATWGYYIGDEVDPSNHSTLLAHAGYVHAADATHPRLFVAAASDSFSACSNGTCPFFDCAEVIGDDYYPFTHNTVAWLDPVTEVQSVQSYATSHSKQSSMVLQAFSWQDAYSSFGDSGQPQSLVFPPALEMRSKRDVVVANATTRLVLWWAYYKMLLSANPGQDWTNLSWASTSLSALPAQIAPVARDNFIRNAQSGWGNAVDGQLWYQPIGTATLAITSVPSNSSFSATITGATGANHLLLGSLTAACNQYALSFSQSSISTDTIGILLHYQDANNYVRVELTNTTINVVRVQSGTPTTLGTTTISTSPSNSTRYYLKSYENGTTLTVSFWDPSYGAELASVTTTFNTTLPTLSSGKTGIYASLSNASHTSTVYSFGAWASALSNYYVSTSGNDNNTGSQSQPFATFQRASNALLPGNILTLLPGIYTASSGSIPSIYMSGTTTTRIQILSQVIQQAQLRDTSATSLLAIHGNYVDVIGLNFTSTDATISTALIINGYANTVQQCHLHDISAPGITGIILAARASTLSNCSILNLASTNTSASTALYITASSVTIQNCLISHVNSQGNPGNIGILVGSHPSSILITGCQIEYIYGNNSIGIENSNGSTVTIQGCRVISMPGTGTTGILIGNSSAINIINSNRIEGIGTGIDSNVSGIFDTTSGTLIQNNIIDNCAGPGIQSYSSATNETIANNLLFANRYGQILISASSGTNDHTIVTNNILRDGSGGPAIKEIGSTGIHNQYLNNLIFGGNVTISLQNGLTASGMLSVDPLLINYQADGSGNYRLQANSPCINAGVSTGAPGRDFDGRTRPQGSFYDIGPFEYAIIATVSAPAATRRYGFTPVAMRRSGITSGTRRNS